MSTKPSSPSYLSYAFRWFPEFWQLTGRRLQPQARLLGLALVVGIVAGCGAIVFDLACKVVVHYALDSVVGYRPNHPEGEKLPPWLKPWLAETDQEFRPWLFLIVATAGGLLSGMLVFTIAPEAEGHGTDAAIAAYHQGQGRIRPRVPLVKIFASALTIGTGGSGGREGPIAQIGAGFGSFLGGLFRMRAAERRVLMAAGMGAGVAAIFRAPLAGALFAAEVLYRSPDFESEVIIPASLASITAYCTFGLVMGFSSLFELQPELFKALTFDNPLHLVAYSLLALFVVVLAMFYTRSFYGLTRLFHRLPIRPHFRPAIGAFLSALLGLGLYYALKSDKVLAVLSFGYGILQDAANMRGDTAAIPGVEGSDLYLALLLLTVAVGKILTTGLTIGSGGSGGVFGPSMVIGGCGGGALGLVLHHFFGSSMTPHPAAFVLVGMAGFFAAAAKTPFSTLVIVSEMTGNYNLLLPTLWVCSLAFLLSDEQSIYSSQVESRSRSPAHQGDYPRQVVANLRVKQFLTAPQEIPTLAPGDRLPRVVQRFGETGFQDLPVIDADGRYLGLVSLSEVLLASQSAGLTHFVVAADLMWTDLTPLQPEDPLDRALELFVESNRLALPVVDGSPEKRLLAFVKRADISSAYLRRSRVPT